MAWYWNPVMMGIATRAEMDVADQEEIDILNEVAKRKFDLMQPSYDDSGGDW